MVIAILATILVALSEYAGVAKTIFPSTGVTGELGAVEPGTEDSEALGSRRSPQSAHAEREGPLPIRVTGHLVIEGYNSVPGELEVVVQQSMTGRRQETLCSIGASGLVSFQLEEWAKTVYLNTTSPFILLEVNDYSREEVLADPWRIGARWGGAVAVQLSNATSESVAFVDVRLQHPADAEPVPTTAPSEDTWTFKAVNPGYCEVMARWHCVTSEVASTVQRSRIVEVEAGQWTRIDLEVSPSAGVEVIGRIRGWPSSGAEMTVRATQELPDGSLCMTTCPVSGLGTFGCSLPQSGKTRFELARLGGIALLETMRDLPRLKSADVTIEFPSCSIKGVVYDCKSRPLAKAVVTLTQIESVEPLEYVMAGPHTVIATDHGEFDFNNVVPGSFRVVAALGVFASSEKDRLGGECSRELALEGGEVANLSLMLLRGCVLRGRIVAADGMPLAWTWLYVRRDEARAAWRAVARTNGDGFFTAVDLVPGKYSFFCSQGEWVGKWALVVSDLEGEVSGWHEFMAERGSRLRIEVRGAGLEPVPFRTVVLDDLSSDLLLPRDQMSAIPRTIGPFPRGPLRVIMWDIEGRSFERTVNSVPGVVESISVIRTGD